MPVIIISLRYNICKALEQLEAKNELKEKNTILTILKNMFTDLLSNTIQNIENCGNEKINHLISQILLIQKK